MSYLAFVLVGLVSGTTTVVFGFGGGFIAVPVMVAVVGSSHSEVAVATSSAVMVVNAAIATATADRSTLARLRGATPLILLLAVGAVAGAISARLVPPRVIAWGFVAYLAITVLDVVLRPGFIRPAQSESTDHAHGITPLLGFPIGGISAFLGVGGSIMTVPLLRRTGLPMKIATTLANPLTLAVATPACATFLALSHRDHIQGTYLIGCVDPIAGLCILAGAIPMILVLRRNPPKVPDLIHTWGYIGLLVIVLGTMIALA